MSTLITSNVSQQRALLGLSAMKQEENKHDAMKTKCNKVHSLISLTKKEIQ